MTRLCETWLIPPTPFWVPATRSLTYEWVMPWRVTYEWVVSHCVAYDWVMSQSVTYTGVMSRSAACDTQRSHVSYDWFVSHTKESCLLRLLHVTHEWVCHIKKSCHDHLQITLTIDLLYMSHSGTWLIYMSHSVTWLIYMSDSVTIASRSAADHINHRSALYVTLYDMTYSYLTLCDSHATICCSHVTIYCTADHLNDRYVLYGTFWDMTQSYLTLCDSHVTLGSRAYQQSNN